MAQIRFTSWQPGFQKVRFNILLCERLGLSLSEAKGVVDAILQNKPVFVEINSTEDAANLLVQAKTLGVTGELK